MTNPKDDPTSIGAILLSMGTITEEELSMALEMQERSSIDRQLGNQLVVLDVCTAEQVEIALAAQARMRKSDHERAVAVADIALARKKRMCSESQRVREQSDNVARRTTGSNYPTVNTSMLAKATDEG